MRQLNCLAALTAGKRLVEAQINRFTDEVRTAIGHREITAARVIAAEANVVSDDTVFALLRKVDRPVDILGMVLPDRSMTLQFLYQC